MPGTAEDARTASTIGPAVEPVLGRALDAGGDALERHGEVLDALGRRAASQQRAQRRRCRAGASACAPGSRGGRGSSRRTRPRRSICDHTPASRLAVATVGSAAMTAPLIAPIDVPTTRSGAIPARAAPAASRPRARRDGRRRRARRRSASRGSRIGGVGRHRRQLPRLMPASCLPASRRARPRCTPAVSGCRLRDEPPMSGWPRHGSLIP